MGSIPITRSSSSARLLRATAALSLASGLAACATGVSTTQTVRVETPGCEAAICELTNDKGRWAVERTPGSVIVTTSRQPLTIACRDPHDDVRSRSAGAPSHTGPASPSGLVAGGAVGAAAGGAMGAAAASALGAVTAAPVVVPFVVMIGLTGAAAGDTLTAGSGALAYPATITVPFICQSPAQLKAAMTGSKLGMTVRRATEFERAAAGLSNGGVVIARLDESGRAARAGLRAGDVLFGVGDREITGVEQLQSLMRAASDTALVFRLRRDGQLVEISIAPSQTARHDENAEP